MMRYVLPAAVVLAVVNPRPVAADTDSSWATPGYHTPSNPATARTNGKRQTYSGLSRGADDAPRSGGCIPARLRSVLDDVEAKFGSVKITSTCRSAAANRAGGGAPRSYHLVGQAIDFRVSGNTRGLYAYLASHGGVGGLKTYGNGIWHIDTGPRRPMN